MKKDIIRGHSRLRVRVLVQHAILISCCALMIMPFVWMVSTSLKPNHEIENAALLPKQPKPDILPITRSGIVTLAIFTFIANFQSFFWPLVMTKDDHLRTIPIGLLNFQTDYGPQIELIMAATTMTIAPLVVIFVIFQKQVVRGIQLGGVKG